MSRGSSEATLEGVPARSRPSKLGLLLLVVLLVVALDMVTKAWVTQNIALYRSVPVLGEFFRLTYTHNRGAAFGINVGEHSRVFFLVLSLVALGVLGLIYRATPAADRLRLFAISLVAGGAIGNIIDRVRYEQGVVDFLDVGLGSRRWPVFNIADSAVSIGAILLLISFYLEGRRERSGADVS